MAGGIDCQSRIGAGLTIGHAFFGIIPESFKTGFSEAFLEVTGRFCGCLGKTNTFVADLPSRRTNETHRTAMRPSDESIADFVAGEWIPTVLCWLFAVPIGLLDLLTTLLQIFATMNLRFERPAHCVIFFVGWLTAACCFYSAYQMMRYPSYKSLWFVLIAGGMLVLDFWLYSLPSAKGLMQ
jgi:hypothetical protein